MSESIDGRAYAGQPRPGRSADERREWALAMELSENPVRAGELALGLAAAKYRHALAEGATD